MANKKTKEQLYRTSIGDRVRLISDHNLPTKYRELRLVARVKDGHRYYVHQDNLKLIK